MSRAARLSALAVVAAMALAACSPAPGAGVGSGPAFRADRQEVSIRLSFDGKARAQMVETGEKLMVSARWFGAPSPDARASLPPEAPDRVPLAQHELVVEPQTQTVTLRGEATGDWSLADLADPTIRIRVDFRPMGANGAGAPISCGHVEDAVPALQNMPTEVLCELAPQPTTTPE